MSSDDPTRSRLCQPLAYTGYRIAWPAIAVAALLFLSRTIWARITLGLIGTALLVEGLYLILDVDDYSGRMARVFSESDLRRSSAMFPRWSWRFHGVGIVISAVVVLIRGVIG